jgi:HK97 family phage prohead protease
MPPAAAIDVVRPRFVAKDDPRRFEIKTGAVRAFKAIDPADGVEKMYLEGTASSTVDDRMGDTLDASAQTKMVAQARGIVMWLNHSYMVPEDILGTCREATLQNASDPTQGECIDLMIRLEIDAENPRAVKAWKHVEGGTKLGFSIGGIWLDFDWKNEDDWMDWRVVVHDVDLLEISLVGIPANPRAYTKGFVEFATRSLHTHIDEYVKTISDELRALPDARAMVKKAMLAPHAGEERPDTTPAQLDALGLEEKTMPPAAEQTAAPAEETPTTEAPLTDMDAFAKDAETAALAAAESGAVVANAEETIASGSATLAPDGQGADLALSETQQRAAATSAGETIIVSQTRSADDGANPLNDDQATAVLSAMRSLKSVHAHGCCIESLVNIALAHKAVRSLLPDDYDVPGDADLPSDPEMPTAAEKAIETLSFEDGQTVVVRGVDETQLATLSAAYPKVTFVVLGAGSVAELDADLAAKTAARDALAGEIAEATQRREALTTEQKQLEDKLAELRATPTGRITAQPGGSTKTGSEPVATPEMYLKSNAEAAAVIGAAAQRQDQNDPRLRATT